MKTLENTPLLTYERQAIAEAVTVLKQQFPIKHAILFGSKARGDADEYSDVDLLLITADQLSWKDKKAIHHVLFEVGMKYDVIFSFICVSIKDWMGGIFTEFPIYPEIIRDGAAVV